MILSTFDNLKHLSFFKWIGILLLIGTFSLWPIVLEGLEDQHIFLRFVFAIGVLLLAWIGQSKRELLAGTLIIGLTGYFISNSDIWAWLVVLAIFSFFHVFIHDLQNQQFLSFVPLSIKRIGFWLLGGGLVSFFLSTANLLETNFGEEEFFVALGAIIITFNWLLLALAYQIFISSTKYNAYTQERQKGFAILSFSVIPLAAVIMIFLIALGYPASFFSSPESPYPGITEQSPFLCGQVSANKETPLGSDVFTELLHQIEGNTYKSVPEYGMLALATREEQWLTRFRQEILEEAETHQFLGPSGSVKFSQYEAALRAYYLHKIMETFPELFSEDELAILRGWFAQINQHALSVGWVDFLYAAAFAKVPEGPYENQENGAGLLAQLEVTGYADPDLSANNRDYLARNVRGWSTRFKNTDDTYLYQREWINNALFQAQFGNIQPANSPRMNLRDLAFEWSLLQLPPDGFPLTYNHPYRTHFAGQFYLGALLTNDPRYIWLAYQALKSSQEGNEALLFAQPGVEAASELRGQSPTEGSCLIFSHTGLPNQKGALAPDKIVMRDGWKDDSSYLLLNLRFTGWHRYKATNTLTSIYKKGPIVIENVGIAAYDWLPRGRSILRDKRIPRENLNGVLMPKQGINRIVYQLTGWGGRWSQDPPHYANIERFVNLGPLDVSQTNIEWHDREYQRDIFFYTDGPIIIMDRMVSDNSVGNSAVSWNFVGEAVIGQDSPPSLMLDNGQNLTKVVLLGSTFDTLDITQTPSTIDWLPNETISTIIYQPDDNNKPLDLLTLFLTEDWLEAEATYNVINNEEDNLPAGRFVSLENNSHQLHLWQNFADKPLLTDEIKLDGSTFSLLSTNNLNPTPIICLINSKHLKIDQMKEVHNLIVIETGNFSIPDFNWQWQEGVLTINFSEMGSGCMEIILSKT